MKIERRKIGSKKFEEFEVVIKVTSQEELNTLKAIALSDACMPKIVAENRPSLTDYYKVQEFCRKLEKTMFQ